MLEDSVFTGLNSLGLANALNPNPFFAGVPGSVSGTTARMIMDDQGSNLTFVDDVADGSGVGAAVLLAQVTSTATLSATTPCWAKAGIRAGIRVQCRLATTWPRSCQRRAGASALS
ncbi:MAG: hypothetical protein NTW00_07690 [Hyphomicrobiales bacterium]|nr:hypothetical protein [Hyphomicrobiales bacterium]